MQLATKVDDEQGLLFEEIAERLGTTPSDALRAFVVAFNARQGFPFDICLREAPAYDASITEEEATELTTYAMMRAIDEAW